MPSKQAFAGGAVQYKPEMPSSVDRSEAESMLRRIPGVEGVGEGRNEVGNPAWIAYVRDRSVASQLPKTAAGRSVVVEVSGEIDFLPAR